MPKKETVNPGKPTVTNPVEVRGIVESVGVVHPKGRFNCGPCDFYTNDYEKFLEHTDKGKHYTIGQRPCFHCGEIVPLTVLEDNQYKPHPDHKHTQRQANDGKVFHKHCREKFLRNVTTSS